MNQFVDDLGHEPVDADISLSLTKEGSRSREELAIRGHFEDAAQKQGPVIVSLGEDVSGIRDVVLQAEYVRIHPPATACPEHLTTEPIAEWG
jgi:hypothetical protein